MVIGRAFLDSKFNIWHYAIRGVLKTVGVTSNEFLLPTSHIVTTTNNAVDSKKINISVLSENGQIMLKNYGKTIMWKPISKMNVGKHIFSINSIQFKNKKIIKPKIHIPFYVINSPAKISSNLAITNFKRIKISGLKIINLDINKKPRGKFFDLLKCVHRSKNTFSEICFDEKGKKIQINKIFDHIERIKLKKFGNIHESLYVKLKKSRDHDFHNVAIWIKMNNSNMSLNKNKKPLSISKKEVKKRISKMRKLQNNLLVHTKPKTLRLDNHLPIIYGKFLKKDLFGMSHNLDITAIYHFDEKGSDSLEDSIRIAKSDIVHNSIIKGNGIKVAVWERGPDILDDLSIEEFFNPGYNPDSTQDVSNHARLTCGIIKNIQSNAPNGHAPSCKIYSANDYNVRALCWAIKTKRCSVISQSFTRTEGEKSDSLIHDDMYKDALILQPPYPTILQAAGNNSRYVNHKGYNSLTVGNHNDSATNMSSSSTFGNPASPHGDRELPEICANGTRVRAVGRTSSGTSFAAPAVAGVTALIQQTNPILKIWPEGCRAILLAGARRNVVDNTWWQDVIQGNDAKDGSGAVDALESVNIADNKIDINNKPTNIGWDVGRLTSSNFINGKSKFSYKIRTPKNSLGERVKIALAWNSSAINIGWYTGSILSLDLDLVVYDSYNNIVAWSTSWDNSYEIAEFNSSPNRIYTIKIYKYSGSSPTWYGIAWSMGHCS